MQNGRYIIGAPAVLNIAERDARALVDAGDGDAALLYLYALLQGGTLDAARAAADLGRSDRDIGLAVERLGQMGLLAEAGAKKPALAPAEELSEYPVREVVRRSREDSQFRGLLEVVQANLGHTMSTPEVTKLFGVYSETDLPPEVIMLLVQFCKEQSEARYGRGRRLTMAYIEKMAFQWRNDEVMTHERAEEWIREHQERESAIGEIKRELGIRDRDLTKTEREYLEKWLSKGFGPEAVAIAADRTITNTSKLSWKYMDSIMESWAGKGLFTPEEIEKKDPRTVRGSKKAAGTPQPSADDGETLRQLAAIREKMRNGQ